LRNGERPWLRFEIGQFAHLATFKKSPLNSWEFESLVKLPLLRDRAECVPKLTRGRAAIGFTLVKIAQQFFGFKIEMNDQIGCILLELSAWFARNIRFKLRNF
jgi:hypothetical protein